MTTLVGVYSPHNFEPRVVAGSTVVAMGCGGSKDTSGVAANPAKPKYRVAVVGLSTPVSSRGARSESDCKSKESRSGPPGFEPVGMRQVFDAESIGFKQSA
jgi:hypothetical protein